MTDEDKAKFEKLPAFEKFALKELGSVGADSSWAKHLVNGLVDLLVEKRVISPKEALDLVDKAAEKAKEEKRKELGIEE